MICIFSMEEFILRAHPSELEPPTFISAVSVRQTASKSPRQKFLFNEVYEGLPVSLNLYCQLLQIFRCKFEMCIQFDSSVVRIFPLFSLRKLNLFYFTLLLWSLMFHRCIIGSQFRFDNLIMLTVLYYFLQVRDSLLHLLNLCKQ